MHRCTSTYNGAKLDQPAGVYLLTQHESTLHSTVLHPIDQLHTDLGFGFGARVYLPQAALAILSRAWILITHKHIGCMQRQKRPAATAVITAAVAELTSAATDDNNKAKASRPSPTMASTWLGSANER